MFDHEKLEVYQLALRFITWVTVLLEEVKATKTSTTREVRDQIDRSSLSSLLNIAEGNGKRYKQLRAKFFDDARGSATESAACLDALVAKSACTVQRITEGKEMLVRMVQMLTRLVQSQIDSSHVRETGPEYGETTEYEHEHEYEGGGQ